MLDQTHKAPHSFPAGAPTLLRQDAGGGDETLSTDLTIIAAGLRVSRRSVFRQCEGRPMNLDEAERTARIATLYSLWAAGLTSVVDEGLLRDAVQRRPYEARLLAFEIANGRAATAPEIKTICGLSAPTQPYR